MGDEGWIARPAGQKWVVGALVPPAVTCGTVRAMRFALAVIAVAASCRYDLDHAEFSDAAQLRPCVPNSAAQSCISAEAHSDFGYVHTAILKPKCTFRGCHNGDPTPAGKFDFRTADAAYTHLVGAQSLLDSARSLVVPGNARQSFLLVMMGSYKPSEADPPLSEIPTGDRGKFVGTMPQDAPVMCCQKLDAIERWIGLGAPNN